MTRRDLPLDLQAYARSLFMTAQPKLCAECRKPMQDNRFECCERCSKAPFEIERSDE